MNAIHHTPGRIRFKFAELQKQQPLANAVQKSIRRLDGVKLVQTNTVTGSLLVHYDLRGEQEKALLRAMREIITHFGFPDFYENAAVDGIVLRNADKKRAEFLVNTLLGKALEMAVERTAIAFVGALI